MADMGQEEIDPHGIEGLHAPRMMMMMMMIVKLLLVVDTLL